MPDVIRDKNQNVTDDGVKKYFYDVYSRLIRVDDQQGNLIASYRYDSNGDLAFRDDAQGVREHYDYRFDHLAIVRRGRTIYEIYQYLPSTGFTEVWLQGHRFALASDANGVHALVQNNQRLQQYYYDPTGNLIRVTDQNGNPGTPRNFSRVLWRNYQYDVLVDLYVHKGRWYSPALGAFINNPGSIIMDQLSNSNSFIWWDPNDPSSRLQVVTSPPRKKGSTWDTLVFAYWVWRIVYSDPLPEPEIPESEPEPEPEPESSADPEPISITGQINRALELQDEIDAAFQRGDFREAGRLTNQQVMHNRLAAEGLQRYSMAGMVVTPFVGGIRPTMRPLPPALFQQARIMHLMTTDARVAAQIRVSGRLKPFYGHNGLSNTMLQYMPNPATGRTVAASTGYPRSLQLIWSRGHAEGEAAFWMWASGARGLEVFTASVQVTERLCRFCRHRLPTALYNQGVRQLSVHILKDGARISNVRIPTPKTPEWYVFLKQMDAVSRPSKTRCVFGNCGP